jgi:hypothetical protein
VAPTWQRPVHLGVLVVASLTLPIETSGIDAGSANTSWWVLRGLASSVGLPFFALSSTAPLLLHWFSGSSNPRARDPYFLYSVSNAGSLLGLLGYLLVEPVATRSTQAFAWSVGFWIVGALVAVCAYGPGRRTPAVERARSARLRSDSAKGRSAHRTLWVLLGLVPSALLVGVTEHLATDVVSVPLLWLVPLALYLVTFIAAFSGRAFGSAWAWGRAAPVAAVLVLTLALAEVHYPILLIVIVHLGAFSALAMLCHTALAEIRPDTMHLTGYFACISLGGVLGGAAAALVAPVVFSSILEYPLAIAVALVLRPQSLRADRMLQSLAPRWAWRVGAAALFVAARWLVLDGNGGAGIGSLAAAAPLAFLRSIAGDEETAGHIVRASLVIPACLLLIGPRTALLFAGAVAGLLAGAGVTSTGGDVLVRERTFFGVHQVTSVQNGEWHVLTHGTTTHGVQAVRGKGRAVPAAYYHPSGPMGDIVFTLAADKRFRNVGVVGLGAGAIAAYTGNGTHMDFFEVDEAVIRLAEDPAYFTYLSDAKARPNVTVRTTAVDGRIGLAAAPPAFYDLIVIDAFSSDAIPTHLLTRDAVALYVSRLAPRGLLAFHVSNRFFNLPPVLARVATALGLQGYVRHDADVPPDRAAEGMLPSVWVILGRDARDAGQMAHAVPRWVPLVSDPADSLWTDDFSNVFAALEPW